MLPPGLQNRFPQRYGSFQVTINLSSLQIMNNVEYVELMMLGMTKGQQRMISKNRQLQFDFTIATNLWFFYAYLHDSRHISITMKDRNGKRYQSQISLNLMHSQQVLSKNNQNIDFLFQNNSFLMNRKAKSDVVDSQFNHFGFIHLQLTLVFHEQINRTLFNASLIDFEDILVIDQISPISSTLQLPQQEFVPLSVQPIKQQPRKQEQKGRQLPTVKVNECPKQQYEDLMQDEKMMEDDIDRLIAQMQNKPYDSSKYMEEVQQPKKQNFNFINTSPLPPRPNRSRQKTIQKSGSIQKYRPAIALTKNNSQFNASHSKLAFTISQPIASYNPISIQSNTNAKSSRQRSNSQQIIQKRTGLIKLKVHQFTMSKMQKELSLLLKIYLNEDSDQFYNINGMKQGETISFNTNLKINQKRQITSIKFVLIDAFDMKTLYAQGTFEMNRLFSLNPTKGIFMVNLLSSNPPQSNMSRVIRLQQQSLVRVTPVMKNLRIELQYEQQIQIVQIYLRLCDFNNQCRKVSYKVPLTKQTIQYKIPQVNTNSCKHINIFPHNRIKKAHDKIIIEVWGQNELIGFNEVNLKPIGNTNQLILNSSIQPILLYDEAREVKDIKSGKVRTSYWMQLYYGTIAQIQNILNKEDNHQKRRQLPNKPIQVQNHLGIYIKQAKIRKEVEIQVDQQQIICKGSQKNLLQLQQQQLPDEDQQQEWAQEHKRDEQNQFMSKSMQQKYVLDKQKQTVPILKATPPSQNMSKSISLSQTTKMIPLKSLTKQFQEWIKDILSDFASEQAISSLKEQIKLHLLYNFIEASTFTSILQRRGISQIKINHLLKDIIPVTNQMINVNILYDMVLGLILQGEIKQKFIDDYQIGRYCLMLLYKHITEMEQDFLFDQNTEFDQSRKIFQHIGFRITMREFNLIHLFIKRTKQNGVMTDKQIKLNLVQKYIQETKQVQTKKVKQKQIISQLYQHQWDQDDDFFISNINQHHHPEESINIQNQLFSNTSKQSQNNTGLYHYPKQNKQTKRQSKSPIKLPVIQKEQAVDATRKQVRQLTKTNYKLTIQGFQTCIDTTQCLLNLPLRTPKLKITCKFNGKEEEFWISKSKQQSLYQIELFIVDSQFLDGSIELTDNLQSIAKCNVSIMADMKSCYSLKNNQTLQFCGILKLLLTSL